jgi:hypothetical protein
MLRIGAVWVVAVLTWASPALGAPELAQNENGDSALVFDILNQGRPLEATSAPPEGQFGSLTTLTPGYLRLGGLRERNVAIDDQGGAVAAWRSVGATSNEPSQAFASVKPPGGQFGPPQRLSDVHNSASVTQVDVNPRGDAVVAWSGSMMYSIRPADGTFSAPAPVPGPLGGDLLAVVLQADGGAVFIGTAPGSGDGYAVYRRPDGMFEPPMALNTPPPLGQGGVAANRRGDVLVAWAENGRVRARERPAGGTFGPPEVVARGSDISAGGQVDAVLNDAGDAAVAFASSWLVIRSHGDGFGPRQARPPFADTLAMNERGDLAIAWVQSFRRVMAVYRAAGGKFGLPMLLGTAPIPAAVSNPPPLVPALALDGAGIATAVWEDSDGETVALRTRRFSAAGPGGEATAATVPTYLQEAPPDACVPAGTSVLAQSPRAVVAGGPNDDHPTGCLLARGVPIKLADFPGGAQWPLRVAVAGPFSALAVLSVCHGCDGSTWIDITDLRDDRSGLSRSGPAVITRTPNAPVPVLRLKRDGSAAWVACPPEKKGARGACSAGSRRIKEVYSFGLSRDTPRLVDRGWKIDPASLRIGTDRIWWRHGARRRSAPLG